MIATGIVLPFLDAAAVADAAVAAERAGWSGLFIAEAVWGVDAWMALTAAAVRTERIRLGTMLTPIARMKPWDLASKAATLDRLSGGRAQLSVGLGALHPGWTAFEPETTRRDRVALMEEGLAIYDGLMRGQPFEFTGTKYTVTPTDFFPPDPPVQRPRVPVWVVGAHPAAASLARAVRWDGLIPNVVTPDGARGPDNPDELAEITAAARAARDAAGLPWDGFDVIAEGITDPRTAADTVRDWQRAGATWWLESDWSATHADLLRRIDAGPPAP